MPQSLFSYARDTEATSLPEASGVRLAVHNSTLNLRFRITKNWEILERNRRYQNGSSSNSRAGSATLGNCSGDVRPAPQLGSRPSTGMDRGIAIGMRVPSDPQHSLFPGILRSCCSGRPADRQGGDPGDPRSSQTPYRGEWPWKVVTRPAEWWQRIVSGCCPRTRGAANDLFQGRPGGLRGGRARRDRS
jgi:hypothetical protein